MNTIHLNIKRILFAIFSDIAVVVGLSPILIVLYCLQQFSTTMLTINQKMLATICIIAALAIIGTFQFKLVDVILSMAAVFFGDPEEIEEKDMPVNHIFRAKDSNSNNLIVGAMSLPSTHFDLETVGMYTGVEDADKNLIFEHDIVSISFPSGQALIGNVIFDHGAYLIHPISSPGNNSNITDNVSIYQALKDGCKFHVVGNVFNLENKQPPRLKGDRK